MMRKAKATGGTRRPDALSRVRRDALSALQAWQQELQNQLALVQSQMKALSGTPAVPSAPRQRKAARKRVKKAARKAARRKPKRRRAAKAKRKRAAKVKRRAPRKAAKKVTRRRRRKATMAQAIVQLLKDKGRPLRPVEIANFIRDEKRYKTKSKNIYNAVMTNLVRSKDLKKTRSGLYTVAK